MRGASALDLEDAFGPHFGDGGLWGWGIVLLLMNMLLARVMGADIPAAVVISIVVAVVGILGWLGYVVRQRQLRLRVLREGRRCEAIVLAKSQHIYNGFDAGGQPFYWLTVRYTLDGAEHVSKARVT